MKKIIKENNFSRHILKGEKIKIDEKLGSQPYVCCDLLRASMIQSEPSDLKRLLRETSILRHLVLHLL